MRSPTDTAARAAQDEDMKGLPVVRVPYVKVYFSVQEVTVKYVLDVQFSGRSWKIEKGFSEIREFGEGLQGGVSLPPFRFAYWKTNKSWAKIAERRAAVEAYFEELTGTGVYVYNQSAFRKFLRISQNLYSLQDRPPPPVYLDTAWWCARDDVGLNLAGCGEELKTESALPETVWLCTPNSSITRDGENGIRIYLPMSKGQPRFDSRLRVIENSIFYGWVANRGDVVPRSDEARAFMKSARNVVKRMIVDRQWNVGSAGRGSFSSNGSGDPQSMVSSAKSEFSTASTAVSEAPSSMAMSAVSSLRGSSTSSSSTVPMPTPPVSIVITPPAQPSVGACAPISGISALPSSLRDVGVAMC